MSCNFQNDFNTKEIGQGQSHMEYHVDKNEECSYFNSSDEELIKFDDELSLKDYSDTKKYQKY